MLTTQKQEQLYSSNLIRTGDALLVKSNSGWLSQLLNLLSGSRFVHTAIAVRIDRHLYVVECKYCSSYSYQLMPIDWWLARNGHEQLFIGKMPTHNKQRNMRRQIKSSIMSITESSRPYKISWLATLYFMRVLLGIGRPQFKRFFKNSKPLICSTLIQEAWERAGAIPVGDYMTPGDLVEMLGGEAALSPVYSQYPNSRQINREASNDASPIRHHLERA